VKVPANEGSFMSGLDETLAEEQRRPTRGERDIDVAARVL
jgi:hypothetical protein